MEKRVKEQEIEKCVQVEEVFFHLFGGSLMRQMEVAEFRIKIT